MNDKSFINLTTEKNLLKLNIDPRLTDNFVRVMLTIQNYFNANEYTSSRKYTAFLKKYVLTDDENQLKMQVNNEPSKRGLIGFYDQLENRICMDEQYIELEEMDAIFCHLFIEFLVEKKVEVEKKESISPFVRDAISEILTRKMYPKSKAYEPQVKMWEFFNQLSQNVTSFVLYLNGEIEKEKYGSVWSKFSKLASAFQEQWGVEVFGMQDAINNQSYLAMQELLLKSYVSIKNIHSFEQYKEKMHILHHRPAPDLDFTKEFLQTFDEDFVKNIGIQKEEICSLLLKQLKEYRTLMLRLEQYNGQDVYEFAINGDVLAIDSSRNVYGEFNGIRVCKWNSMTNIFRISVNHNSVELDMNSIDFTKRKKDLLARERNIEKIFAYDVRIVLEMICQLEQKKDFKKLEKFILPRIDTTTIQDPIELYLATYVDHIEVFGSLTLLGTLKDIRVSHYIGISSTNGKEKRCFKPLYTINEVLACVKQVDERQEKLLIADVDYDLVVATAIGKNAYVAEVQVLVNEGSEGLYNEYAKIIRRLEETPVFEKRKTVPIPLDASGNLVVEKKAIQEQALKEKKKENIAPKIEVAEESVEEESTPSTTENEFVSSITVDDNLEKFMHQDDNLKNIDKNFVADLTTPLDNPDNEFIAHKNETLKDTLVESVLEEKEEQPVVSESGNFDDWTNALYGKEAPEYMQETKEQIEDRPENTSVEEKQSTAPKQTPYSKEEWNELIEQYRARYHYYEMSEEDKMDFDQTMSKALAIQEEMEEEKNSQVPESSITDSISQEEIRKEENAPIDTEEDSMNPSYVQVEEKESPQENTMEDIEPSLEENEESFEEPNDAEEEPNLTTEEVVPSTLEENEESFEETEDVEDVQNQTGEDIETSTAEEFEEPLEEEIEDEQISTTEEVVPSTLEESEESFEETEDVEEVQSQTFDSIEPSTTEEVEEEPLEETEDLEDEPMQTIKKIEPSTLEDEEDMETTTENIQSSKEEPEEDLEEETFLLQQQDVLEQLNELEADIERIGKLEF